MKCQYCKKRLPEKRVYRNYCSKRCYNKHRYLQRKWNREHKVRQLLLDEYIKKKKSSGEKSILLNEVINDNKYLNDIYIFKILSDLKNDGVIDIKI
ncbi:MAG: hypothetical protein ACOC56_03870 [Atribacterota bacterium]